MSGKLARTLRQQDKGADKAEKGEENETVESLEQVESGRSSRWGSALGSIRGSIRGHVTRTRNRASKIATNNANNKGFSKGCVVLNQLLHEFYHYNAVDSILDSSTKSFIGNVKKMIWLDGGHSGHEDTWITSNPILKNFAKMGISVDVHITPYQIKDERRPWLRREEKIFSGQLQKFGAIVRRVVHFEEETPTLDNHFRILKDF